MSGSSVNPVQFQSTHPVRGATSVTVAHDSDGSISIHAPRAGCDQDSRNCTSLLLNFNPRTPCGVRLALGLGGPFSAKISIHAPRAGCDFNALTAFCGVTISIHAPRAGCDTGAPWQSREPGDISIHAPRAGCDRRALTQVETLSISIHVPRAGCDEKHMQSIARCANFNPRTPCGVRLCIW